MLVGAFALTCALQLIPVYIEGNTVGSSINNAIKNNEFDGMSISQMKSKIYKTFDINRVESLRASDVKIKSNKGTVTIDANYEKRLPLIFNIDVVVKFDKLVYEFTTK